MISPMLGTLLPGFHFTPEQSADVAFAQALGLIAASLCAGPLIDLRGKKTALLAGLGMAVLALSLLPLSGGCRSAMALMGLLGLGGGAIVTGANALAGDVNVAQRASTLNLLNVFFGLGGLLTPFIAARLFAGNAISLCYLVAGLAGLTFVAHVFTPMPAPGGERGFKLSDALVLAGQPALYLLALLLFLYVACEVGVWNWLAKHLTAQGVAESDALTILSLGFALGLLVGRLVVSRLLIRIPALRVTLHASILIAVTTYLAIETSSAIVAWVTVFCTGLAMAPVFPTTLAMAADAFPRTAATAMGIVITAGWTGLAVSSKIIGSIAGGDDGRLKTALLVLPAFALGMVAVNLVLKPMLARLAASETEQAT